MEHKKLYRSQKDRFIAGVCGGLGKYFGIDATIIRVAWVILIFTTGFIPFLLVYILCALIRGCTQLSKSQKLAGFRHFK